MSSPRSYRCQPQKLQLCSAYQYSSVQLKRLLNSATTAFSQWLHCVSKSTWIKSSPGLLRSRSSNQCQSLSATQTKGKRESEKSQNSSCSLTRTSSQCPCWLSTQALSCNCLRKPSGNCGGAENSQHDEKPQSGKSYMWCRLARLHHKAGVQSSRKRRSPGKARPVVCQFENLPLLRLQNAGNALHKRIWRCPDCGAEHNRDVNAAFNIRQIGILELKAAGLIIPAHGGQHKSVKLTQRAKKTLIAKLC